MAHIIMFGKGNESLHAVTTEFDQCIVCGTAVGKNVFVWQVKSILVLH